MCNLFTKKENIGIFIQAEDRGDESIRYIAVGEMDMFGLTGVIYGYEGGGEFSENYCINGELMNQKDEHGEYFENDEVEKNFIEYTSPDFLDACYDHRKEYAVHDDNYDLEPTEKLKTLLSKIPVKDKSHEGKVLTLGSEIDPVSYGTTYWE